MWCVLLAGCGNSGSTVTVAAPDPADPTAPSTERICEETLIEMDDGVRLYAWASRVAPDGPRPVRLFLTPYRNNACPTDTVHNYANQDQFLSPEVANRMTLVDVSMRGTGSSEGAFEHLGPRTQQDIRAVVSWAAQQAWSNGSIVVMGHSGTGFEDVFTLSDPHVKAVFARSTCFDTYRGCFRPGGLDNAVSDVYESVLTAGYVQGLPARLRLGLVSNPSPPAQLAAIADVLLQFKTRDVYDAWWQARSGLGALPQVTVPVFYGTDVFDILPSSSYLAYERTPGARLTLGWGHTAETSLLRAARAAELLIKPLDRFVLRYGFNENSGIENEPPVQLVTTLGSVSGFITGQVLVRGEDAWPLPDTQWARLYLDAGRAGSALSLNDGALALAPATASRSDMALMASTLSLHASFRTALSAAGYGHEGIGAPQAVAPLSDMRVVELLALSYSSAPLSQNLEVTGPIVLRLYASSSAADFDWVVNLTDVWPDGRSEWISDGFQRASLRRVDESASRRNAAGDIIRPWYPFETKEPVPAGEVVEYLIEITPISNVFQAGHRIRLDLFPALSGLVDSVLTGGLGTLTIFHGSQYPSSLLLPVIPGRCQDGVPLVGDLAPPERCASNLTQAFD